MSLTVTEAEHLRAFQKLMLVQSIVKSYTSSSIYEWDDKNNAPSIYAKCSEKLPSFGVHVLGIKTVPGIEIERVEVGGLKWDMARLVRGSYSVPQSVYERMVSLENCGWHFSHYIWLEEVYYSPIEQREVSLFVPNADPSPLRFTPVPEEMPKVTAFKIAKAAGQSALKSMQVSARESVREFQVRGVDPILIGVVPTSPNEGVWCVLGKWFH